MPSPQRLTAVAVASVVLAATGCSSGTNASGGSDTLRISAVATDRAGTEAVIKAFKAKNPGVEFTTSYADTDQYQGTLRTQLSSGTAPDVFFACPATATPAPSRCSPPPVTSPTCPDAPGRPRSRPVSSR